MRNGRAATLAALAALALPLAVGVPPAGAEGETYGDSTNFFHNFRTRDGRETGCGGFVSATVFRPEGDEELSASARIILNEDTSPECRASLRLFLDYHEPSGSEVHTSIGGGPGYALLWRTDDVGRGSFVATGEITFEDCDVDCRTTATVRAK